MTRSQTLVPSLGAAQDVGFIVGGAALTMLGAQVIIPLQPVPFTLQTLSVCLCGLALGAKRGALSQVVYLAAGAAGAPVFAEYKGGLGTLFGPTGGFILSFVLVAGLLGWLAERGWDRNYLKCACALAIGNALTLLLGGAWLSMSIGWPNAWVYGVAPFIPIEAAKSGVVVLALPSAQKLLGLGGPKGT